MADNKAKYGFRFYSSMTGSPRPPIVEGYIATAYQPNVSATDVGLSIGDPVSQLATGYYALAEDVNTDDRLFGVIAGFANVKVDSNGKARPASYYPGGTTYTTEANRTKVLIMPFGRDIWEIDAAGQAGTTFAEWIALYGLNADLQYDLDVSNPDRPRAKPVLSATLATTQASNFRLVGVSKTLENQDFSGANVKLLVQLNTGSEPMLGPAGVVGL
jgi:hypothetical protein